MKTFFQMRNQKSFPNHKGRPGFVGGSLPKDSFTSVTFSRDPENTTQDTLDWVKIAYEDLPKSERSKSTVAEIKVFDNPEDVLVAIENAGIDPCIDDGGVVYGAYDFDNKVMYVSVWNGYENSLRNFYHEFGHSIVGTDEDTANAWADAWENKNMKHLGLGQKSLHLKGGPGSGFHNHKGRPGKIGGSQQLSQLSNVAKYSERLFLDSSDTDNLYAIEDEISTWPESLRKEIANSAISDIRDNGMKGFAIFTEDSEFAGIIAYEDNKDVLDTTFSDVAPDFDYIYIANLATKKEGFGKVCLQEVINVAASQNKGLFFLSTEDAESYYEYLGFHRLEGAYFYFNSNEVKSNIAKSLIQEPESGAFIYSIRKTQKSFMKSTWRPWSIFENTFTSVIFNALKEQLQLLIGWDDIANIGNDSSFWLQLDNLLNRSVLPIVQQIAQKAAKDAVGSIAMTVSYDMTNMAASEWAMLYSASQITKVNDTTKDAVRKAISEWIASGENGGIQELRKLLGELKDGNGQPLFDEARAKRIAQSELTSIYAGAKAKALEANGYRKAVFLPRAHTNCRCYIQPATAPDGTKVIVWYTARDEMVCTREIETPFGKVKGCRELHRTIVSEGYAGQKFESNQWNPEEAQQ